MREDAVRSCVRPSSCGGARACGFQVIDGEEADVRSWRERAGDIVEWRRIFLRRACRDQKVSWVAAFRASVAAARCIVIGWVPTWMREKSKSVASVVVACALSRSLSSR